ncbi:helix-turn-helix domain-containing protein [Rhodococcus pyridinivorans]|uniref:helix-turn-helix domain-containing protein n=1 Tax=Rhodococcus pyridinivorans TaxID=103816 RepID=UPI0019056C21|nr:helix-turn-helix domain-containing protein [Rhodococcus pyridinivorans]
MSDDQGISERRPFRSRITARTRAEAIELYNSGLSALDVAEQLGVGKSTVLKILKHEGVTVRPRGKRIT